MHNVAYKPYFEYTLKYSLFVTPTTVYDALNVTRIDKESATTSLEATDHLEDDSKYTCKGHV